MKYINKTNTGSITNQIVRPDVPAPPSGAPSREQIENALQESRGNISHLSRILGRSRRQVYRYLEMYNKTNTGSITNQIVRPDVPAPHSSAPSREQIENALQESRGNISHLSRVLSRSRRQVYRYLEMYGLDLTAYRK